MKRRRSQRGEVMLEFALVAPALLLLCFGAMDLSRAYRTALIAASAARAGIHFASTSTAAGNNAAGIETAAKLDASNMEGLTASVEHYCTCSIGGAQVSCTNTCTGLSKYVKVTTSAKFDPMLKIPGLAPSFNVKSVSHLRIK